MPFPPPVHVPCPACPPCPQPLVLARSLAPALWAVSRVPTSVSRALAFSAGARVLPVPLPVSFVVPCVPPSAARALACPLFLSSPAAAGPGALPVPLPPLTAACAVARPLRPPPGEAARACVLPMPLPVSFVVPCVPPSAALALARPVCLSSPAAAGPGALPVSLPSLIAGCALARALCLSSGAPSVAFCPLPRVPVVRTPPRPFAVSSLLDHAPGIPLLLQLVQRDARRRTLGRRGAEGPRPPLGEGGFARVRLWGGCCGSGRAWCPIFHYPQTFFCTFWHLEGPMFRLYHSMANFVALFSILQVLDSKRHVLQGMEAGQ